MPKLEPPEETEKTGGEEAVLGPIPSHPTWYGSISIGLVNILIRQSPSQ